MLGKLLKYELKATGRKFIPIYIALIVFALIQTFLGKISLDGFKELNLVVDIATIVLFSLFIALGAITIVVTVERFYKNLLRDEGYLMFTLPVTPRQLVLSKLITTCIWGVISILVSLGVFLILFSSYSELRQILVEGVRFIKEFIPQIDGALIVEGITLIVGEIFSVILTLLTVYLALAISQVAFANKYRIPVAFISFLILNVIIGYCASGLILISKLVNISEAMVGALGNLILAVIIFELTNYVLKQYINLE